MHPAHPHMTWTPRLPSDTQPLYAAIADAIADDAESGRLAAGTRLPTHRALAATLGVDVTTVSRAYSEARRRGLVVGHVGRGTYVRGARPSPATRTAAPLVDLTVNLPPEPSDTCDAAMRRSLADIGRSPTLAALLAYAPVGGSVEHREAGVAWCASHGITASVDRLAVCGGAQQALTSVLSAHCEPGDVVLTEALTYPGFLAAARLLRLRTVGVSMEDREALLGYANHSMAGHYASADVGRLLGQANLVLRRKETRTVLRVANAESLWIKGPAEVRQNEKRAHLTLVRSRRREVRVVGPSRSRRSRVAPSPRVLLSRRMSSPTAQDWWPQEFTTSEFGQVRRSATGF